ncbi:E3 ubiquitin-protein ligase SH3RF3 isoform X2 [Ischnura elegans]|uniref:E3 ubiquitin-protein ligase SH3RF3 isoform X2 n=1 Tax=Ischnura elegans TaxID=197161 RepID=UPI001ED88B10|nr:E3 ubiquitin-protein ligase SH3RF3 isoform X2 [Ischnura elegans]
MDEWMLNDLLECSVCLERLDTSSKVLPCQHTFCRKCLEEIVSTHKELRCPECRILVELRIDDLPPNVLLMRILEGMRNAPKKRGVSNSASTSSRPHPAMLLQQQQQGFLSSPHNPQPQQQSPGHQHHHRTYLAPHPAAREHHSIRSHHSPKQPVFPNQPCAKALFSYQSRVPGDLIFKKGDIILLKKKIDVNWYEGELAGNTGVFPSTYVQVITPLPSHIPQCKALYDFKMTNDDEEGCLTFKKGEILTVIRRVDENWAEGKLADRIGIFPLAFVELNDIARALVKLSSNSQPGPSRVAPPTPTSEDATPLIPTDHLVTSAPSMMANPHYSSTSFHSTPPSQSSPLVATTTVSASHPAMPLHQANQMAANSTPHHHHQSRHGHHRHHHSQSHPQPPQATASQAQQVLQTAQPATTVVSTPLSSSVSSSTSSSPSSSTSSTPSSSTSASSSSSSTATTNSPNGSSVPSSIPSSPASPPPPPLPPPLPPSSGSSQEVLSAVSSSAAPTTSGGVMDQPQVQQRGPSSSRPPSPGSSFPLPQQYQREKRHSFNVLHSNQNFPQQATHRHSAEILSPTNTSAPEHLPEDQSKDCQPEGSSGPGPSKSSQHRHRRSGSDLASSTSSSSQGPSSLQDQSSSSAMLPASYVALYPYKPQKSDELELRKGSVYTVTEKCQDGWFKGTSLRTHKSGVFPGNYVALVRPPDPPPPYRQPNQNGSSPQVSMSNHGMATSSSASSRLSSGSSSSPSRPSGHGTSPQASISPSSSNSSRIPVASVSPSAQSFTRGKVPMPPAVPPPSSHGLNTSGDGRHFGEGAQSSSPSPHGGNVPPKPPRPHSPHIMGTPSHHHQPQHSLPVNSPPPELPPRSSSPSPHHHHHFHPPPPSSLTTSAPPPSGSTSGMLGGSTPSSTSSSWHACHQPGESVPGSRGSPGGPHTPLSTAVAPPPNISVGSSPNAYAPAAPGPSGRPSPTATTPYSDKMRDKKDRGSSGVSLMRRLTSMKSKSKSPPLAPSSYSMDNPVFEDGCMVVSGPSTRPSGQILSSAHQTPHHGSPGTHSVHVRSNPGVVGVENGSASATGMAVGGGSSSSSGGHRKSNSLDAGTCLSSGGSGDSVKKSKQLVPPVKERFRCIVAYPPNSEYELELKVGDVIYVHRKRDDGWYKGTLQRTGRTGLFPASFVEAF